MRDFENHINNAIQGAIDRIRRETAYDLYRPPAKSADIDYFTKIVSPKLQGESNKISVAIMAAKLGREQETAMLKFSAGLMSMHMGDILNDFFAECM